MKRWQFVVGPYDTPWTPYSQDTASQNSARCDPTIVRIVQSDAAPRWQANPSFLVARSSALLSLFAVPHRMSFLVCLLCFIFHALYALLCSLRSTLFCSLRSSFLSTLFCSSAPRSPLSAAVQRGARHFRTERGVERKSGRVEECHSERAVERRSDRAVER